MAKIIYLYEHRSKKKSKNDFEIDFFKLVNNAFFGKTMENVRKNWDIKLVTTEKRRSYLVSGPNYDTTKCFAEHAFATGMKKTETLMNKPVCSGFSILELSKILMYDFWYDYIKLKK